MPSAKEDTFQEARVQFLKGHYRRAVDQLQTIEQDGDVNPDIYYYLGLSYLRLEDFEQAKLSFERTLSAHYDILRMFQIRMLLGYIAARQEDYAAAETEFRNAIKLNASNASAYAALGHTLFMQNKGDDALDAVKSAVDIDPQNSNALNSIGYIMIDRTDDNENNMFNGIRLCEKALKQDPDNPYILDSLGWGYYKLGKPARSKAYFQKAFAKLSDNKILRDHFNTVLNES